jgi:hypothetical protein
LIWRNTSWQKMGEEMGNTQYKYYFDGERGLSCMGNGVIDDQNDEFAESGW